MADLTVQDLSDEDGAAVTMSAADVAGDKFVWSDKAIILIRNGDVAPKQVTVTAVQGTVSHPTHGELTRSNIVLSVAAGATAIIPPLPVSFRNSADANKVAISYDAVTSLTVGIFRVG